MSDDELVTAADLIAQETLEDIELEVQKRKCCTYTQQVEALAVSGVEGFAQPIYSCKTCAAEQGEFVGICEPCMLRCHAEHEVIEVGTRRQFRCDCPTVKSAVTCSAQPPSEHASSAANPDTSSRFPKNTKNVYGHNFENKFCKCDTVYDRDVDELMQCISCDDWFHPVHLGGRLPSSLLADSEVLVCDKCVGKLPFCSQFATYEVGQCTGKPAISADVSAESASNTHLLMQPWAVCLSCTEGADDGRGVCAACAVKCHAGHVLSNFRLTEFECDCGELTANCPCLLQSSRQPTRPELPKWCCNNERAAKKEGEAVVPNLSMFMADESELINKLCRCTDCLRFYSQSGIATWFFDAPEPIYARADGGGLLEDVKEHAEALRAASGSPQGRVLLGQLTGAQLAALIPTLPQDFRTSYEQNIAALHTLPVTQRVDAIHGYNDFSGAFMTWLRTNFGGGAGGGEARVITAEHIRAFLNEYEPARRVRPRHGDGDGAEDGDNSAA